MSKRTGDQPKQWTTHELLSWISTFLAERRIESPRLCAEILVAHVLQCERLQLYTQFDRPADVEERERLRDLVARAARHEPVAYLTGEAWFFGLALEVTRDTLIPRPSTETIVEYVLHDARQRFSAVDGATSEPRPFIADIGTGSGAIAIALAVNLPQARIIATDVSPGALAVARRNAARHEVSDRIEFREGSLYEPLADVRSCGVEERFDYLISNPPYISDREWAEVPPTVKAFEPVSALRAGEAGMDYLDPLIATADDHLRRDGTVLLEMAASQTRSVSDALGRHARLISRHILRDLDGHDRVLVARPEQCDAPPLASSAQAGQNTETRAIDGRPAAPR